MCARRSVSMGSHSSLLGLRPWNALSDAGRSARLDDSGMLSTPVTVSARPMSPSQQKQNRIRILIGRGSFFPSWRELCKIRPAASVWFILFCEGADSQQVLPLGMMCVQNALASVGFYTSPVVAEKVARREVPGSRGKRRSSKKQRNVLPRKQAPTKTLSPAPHDAANEQAGHIFTVDDEDAVGDAGSFADTLPRDRSTLSVGLSPFLRAFSFLGTVWGEGGRPACSLHFCSPADLGSLAVDSLVFQQRCSSRSSTRLPCNGAVWDRWTRFPHVGEEHAVVLADCVARCTHHKQHICREPDCSPRQVRFAKCLST
jgi:hypothetical protein